MVRRSLQVLGLLVLWVALSWGQTYGPGEIYYGGIRLQFSGRVLTTGTCAGATQPAPGATEIRCQVPEGVAGTIELAATRTPAGGAVNIRAEPPPAGWPTSLWTRQPDGGWADSRSPVASGWGTVTAQYRFTPPAGSAGRRVELRFKAWTAGVIGELELRLILDIVRAVTPTPPPTEPTVPPSYGPFTGTTDASGWFEVPIGTLPNTSVTGKLTECTVKPLPRTQVSVTLTPKPGVTMISRADQIGTVRVSSPGYIETEIVQLQFASSMDLFGRTYTTVGTGTVCLRPTTPVTPPPDTSTGPISGKTDGDGKFTATIGLGTTVTGRLTECTVRPLPNQEFTLTLVPKAETLVLGDLGGFTFAVPGYAAATVTQFSTFSLFGLTNYDLGDVCLSPAPGIDCDVFCRDLLWEDTPIREIGIFDITFSDAAKYTECWCKELGMILPPSVTEEEIKRILREVTGKEIKTLSDKLLESCLRTPHVRPGDGIAFQADYRPPWCVTDIEWFVREQYQGTPLLVKRGETYTLSGEETLALWNLFRKEGEEGHHLIFDVVCRITWCGSEDALFAHSIQLILGSDLPYPPDCERGEE